VKTPLQNALQEAVLNALNELMPTVTAAQFWLYCTAQILGGPGRLQVYFGEISSNQSINQSISQSSKQAETSVL